MRFLLFLSICMILLLGESTAQITIESSEYDVSFNSQVNLYSAYDTSGLGMPVNLGATGGPQTWTFNTADFPGGDYSQYTVVDPAQTAYTAQFPTSDHAWVSTSDTMSFYQYFTLNNNGLYLDGFVFASGDTASIDVNDPSELLVPFPLMMGKTWQNTDVSETDFGGQFITKDSTVEQYEVDAWGTVFIDGDSYDCLRAKGWVQEFSQTYFMGTLLYADTSRFYEYGFYTEGEGFIADITSFSGETNPNFTKAEDITLRVTTAVGISEQGDGNVVEGYALSQNYPNPFNPATRIAFTLAESGFVTLKVYDLQGRQVASLLNGFMDRGHHERVFNAADLAAGMYVYELRAGSFTAKRKMLLLK